MKKHGIYTPTYIQIVFSIWIWPQYFYVIKARRVATWTSCNNGSNHSIRMWLICVCTAAKFEAIDFKTCRSIAFDMQKFCKIPYLYPRKGLNFEYFGPKWILFIKDRKISTKNGLFAENEKLQCSSSFWKSIWWVFFYDS